MDFAFDQNAAWIRRSGEDLVTFVEALATRLESSLPGYVEVVRKKDGLFSAHRHVESVAVHTQDYDYQLHFDGHHVTLTRARMVRGVVLKRDTLDFSAWLQGLLADLATLSQEMQGASQSLHDFLMQ